MPRRRKGSKKADDTTQILSEALESVVTQPLPSHEESHFTIKSTPRRVKKSKNQKYNPSSIQSYAELIEAIEAGEPHLVLGDNIIVEQNILIKQNLIIDFNGFSIIAEDTLPSARILDIRSGEVTLAGRGKVFAMGPNGVAVRVFGAISSGIPEYTVLHVGPDIQLFAPNAYGILVSPNLGVAYGLTVNFAGRIFARDGICIANGINGHDLYPPHINIKSGSSIVADEASGAALEATGYGSWQITEARLSGAVGANLKSGQLEFVNPQIIANAGPAINLIENSTKDLEVSLTEGNYVSMISDLIMGAPNTTKKFTIKNCTFYGTQSIASPELKTLVKPKSSSPLRSDIAAFLETLIPQSDLSAIALTQESIEEKFLAEEVTPNEPTTITEAEPELKPAPTLAEIFAPIADTAVSTTDEDDILVDIAQDSVSELELLDDETTDVIDAFDFEDTNIDGNILEDLTNEPQSQDDSSTELKITHDKKPLAQSVPADDSVAMDTTANLSTTSVSEPATLGNIPTNQPVPYAHSATVPPSQPIVAYQQPAKSNPSTPYTLHSAFGAPVQPALLSEQEAARRALTDAIAEIRKLKPEDYEAGYADLARALRKAEHILASPLADLADIRDTSSMLLQAFDSLEERDEFSLSDEELDELFYHGAVLEEVAHPEKPAKSSKASYVPPSTLKTAPVIISSTDAASSVEPDFSVLSEIISTIAGLKLDNYTPESQESLLDELDRAENILANMSSSQSEIDEIATSLLAEMSKLERARPTHATPGQIRISTPAPVVGSIFPTTMIDEMAPATNWMLGTTMIDELTPYSMDITTRQQIVRAMRPWINEFLSMTTAPLKKLSHSIRAGIRAGRHAYQESLHSGVRF